MTSNYVGAAHDWDTDTVLVWERNQDGERTVRKVKAPRYFYVPHKKGTYTSIYGDKLERLDFGDIDEFNLALKQYKDKFESDIPPLFKVLMNEYYEAPLPPVNFAFIDIETDVKMSVGWSTIENPYAPINAVTVYQSWTDKMLTFAVPPKGYEGDYDFEALKAEYNINFELNVTICKNEFDLLHRMVDAIQDSDILSGWNSEFFDLPYIMKRLERVAPPLAYKMSFVGAKKPRAQITKRFGKEVPTYKLSGRTHLDYLDLFKKFAQDVRYPSYQLGFVGENEVKVPKVHFDGTFEDFYNGEFKKFIVYNARDVDILVKINHKRKLIELINKMAHDNTCLFENLLGTVRYVETALINRAHHIHRQIVRDKRMMTDGEVVDGALVLDPRAGLHEWLGSVDINSLYPSVIRALNISPEKFIGQFVSGNASSETMSNGEHFFRPSAGELDWRGIIDEDDYTHILQFDDGETFEATGKEWKKLLLERKWAITAYGTVFDQSEGLGVIPLALQDWYAERKAMQAEKKKWSKIYYAMKEDKTIGEKLDEALLKVEDFELNQMSKKLTLNSTYGAMLSPHFGLGRKEMGASTTACGRAITKHMIETIAFLLTGKHDHVKWYGGGSGDKAFKSTKINNERILLSDTDSCYFVTGADNIEDAVLIADEIAKQVNDSFPAFMMKNFLIQSEHKDLIKAGREIVGKRGLFLNAKKKYTIKVVDKEGQRVNELKTMGSELKKVDTPKVVQDFLRELMDLVLEGADYSTIETFVNKNRKSLVFKIDNPLELGASKGINNLDNYYADWKRTEKPGKGKVRLPGHVRAAINYNEMAQALEGPSAKLLGSGDKGRIFYLKPNDYGLKSIAIPNDFEFFPKWFDEHFRLDRSLTEQKMIDMKLEGIFEALGWEIPTLQTTLTNKILRF